MIVGQPEFYKALQSALTTLPLDQWKAYLRWSLITGSASYLSKPLVDEHFNFYSKVLRGTKEQRPRWKRVLDQQKAVMGELVGQLFVKKYFNETAKLRYEHMAEAIRNALKARIERE